MRRTYHLVPRDDWTGRVPGTPYVAPSLATEGFIHCTDGADELIATANRYYRDDPRRFLVVAVDLDATGSPWRFDDPSGIYPHIYGPVAAEAILDVVPVERDPDGRFIRLAAAPESGSDAVVIRAYRTGDGDALRDLWARMGFRLIADDDAGLTSFAERNPGLFLVAESSGTIIATAMGGWDGRRGWLYHVATTPERRGEGIASELTRRLEDGLRLVGCRRAVVMVEEANAEGLSFWQRRGYELRPTRQLGKSL